jgi:hypothetical protein
MFENNKIMIDLHPPNLGLLRNVTLSIRDSQRPAHSLRPEVVEMTKILTDSQSLRTSRENISQGETLTHNGLALSPTMAAMCADDFVRTIRFIRGTHAAIVDVRKQHPHRAARVLEIGCGPNATLVVPLMTIFSPEEAVFTLLDIHPESIESAKCIVETLGLGGSVAGWETMDAGSYRIDPDSTPDVILMEIMRACLQSEPQVALTRHLLPQAPDAILVPEEVRVELALVNPSREFSLDGVERDAGDIQRDRIPVASVFVLNRETVNSWRSICGTRLPGFTIRLPDSMPREYQPMLFTNIRVYQKHVLMDYDSGLTCPKTFSSEAGVTISFHYELGQNPRLISEVVPG